MILTYLIVVPLVFIVFIVVLTILKCRVTLVDQPHSIFRVIEYPGLHRFNHSIAMISFFGLFKRTNDSNVINFFFFQNERYKRRK